MEARRNRWLVRGMAREVSEGTSNASLGHVREGALRSDNRYSWLVAKGRVQDCPVVSCAQTAYGRFAKGNCMT